MYTIKNKKELIGNVKSNEKTRKLAIEVLEGALAAVDPVKLIKEMINAGYPLCYQCPECGMAVHCDSCIRQYLNSNQ